MPTPSRSSMPPSSSSPPSVSSYGSTRTPMRQRRRRPRLDTRLESLQQLQQQQQQQQPQTTKNYEYHNDENDDDDPDRPHRHRQQQRSTTNDTAATSSSTTTTTTHNHNNSYVWVQVEVVEAIRKNHGTLPHNWKPSATPTTQSRRQRNAHSNSSNDHHRFSFDSSNSNSSSYVDEHDHYHGYHHGSSPWGWCRAIVLKSSSVSSSSSPSSTSSTSPLRSTASSRHRKKTIVATLQIDDEEFAPQHLQGITVCLSYPDDVNTAGGGFGDAHIDQNGIGMDGNNRINHDSIPSSSRKRTTASGNNSSSSISGTKLVYNANTWWLQPPQRPSTTSLPSTTAMAGTTDSQPPQDLTSLVHLHEPAVVYCLQRHYQQKSIYVYTGKILLAMNPFQYLTDDRSDPSTTTNTEGRRVGGGGTLYGEHIMRLYYDWDGDDDDNSEDGHDHNNNNSTGSHHHRTQHQDERQNGNRSSSSSPPPPHVYAVAQEAYRSMMSSCSSPTSRSTSTSLPSGTTSIAAVANQTILVSGESGSGKTVTTKIIMGYLAGQSQRRAATATAATNTTKSGNDDDDSGGLIGTSTSTSRGGGVESQILQSNPILESFGNARTVRNDNSSRFGKFMELIFTPTKGRLVSASIETYLLEKVRLISQSHGERNYHIFYELLAGLSPTERIALHMAEYTPQDFVMTSNSGTFDRRDGVKDYETYQELRTALSTVGFTKSHQRDLFSVACALLHTSNLTFVMNESTTNGDDGSQLDHQSPSLTSVIELLGVPHEALNNALCLCAIQARGETFHKNLTVDQATKALEALIKATYGALFTHIVRTINESIGMELQLGEENTNNNVGSGGRVVSDTGRGGGSKAHRTEIRDLPRIGVLDIFGFESFETNSFEQLCINYCNEALQQQFNKYVFKLEQQEYEREGIDWSFIEFPDNQDILDLIEKRRDGILSILDENCRLASSTDSTFCRTIYDKYEAHSRFSASRAQQVELSFSIQHYAGTVTYNAVGFVEKNKDELPKETTELLTSSSVPFLAYLGELLSESEQKVSPHPGSIPRAGSPTSSTSSYSFGVARSATSSNGIGSETNGISPMRPGLTPSGKKSFQRSASSILRDTVGHQFSLQLRDLRDRIDSTKPHYVRCLKPNDDLVPNRFEPHVIADQLRCAGVLEAIRVSRVGFPHRYLHGDFVDRYSMIIGSMSKSSRPNKDHCLALVKKLRPHIHSLLDDGSNAATRGDTQRIVGLGMQMGRQKVFLRSKLYDALEILRNRKLGKAAIVIQTCYRRYFAETAYLTLYEATITLQCFIRQVSAHRSARRKREIASAVKIQTVWRRFYAETELMAARLIAHFCQAHWRGAIARQLYEILTVEKQAFLVQRWWRGQRVRREFCKIIRSAISIQCCWRSRLARRIVRERRREARSLGVVVAERDKFKEESHRLKKEVERLRLSKAEEEVDRDKSSYEEVERLRREVERLQTALAVTQGSVEKASRELGLVEHPADAIATALSTAWPSPVKRLNMYEASSPNTSKFQTEQITPTSIMSPDCRSSTASSANVSLLDTETDVVSDFQFPNTSQHRASPDRSMLHGSVSESILDDHVHEDIGADEHPHRMEQSPLSPFPGANENLVRLHGAIWENNLNEINDVLENSLDPLLLVNEPNKDEHTALHVAVESNNIRAARLLFEKAAVANAQNNDGDTPLHLATDVAMVKLLLEHGNANPNIPNVDGVCALHKAVKRLDAGSVRLLLHSRAKVDVADNANWFTPMHLAVLPSECDEAADPEAAQRSRTMIVDLLCWDRDHLDLNYQDHEGNTPLHYAVQIETPEAAEIVGTLLEKGADPNINNARNQQALLLLCLNNALRKSDSFQETLHALLFHGADPNHQSNTGCTPLHLSLYHNDVDAAVQLVHDSAELHLLWRKPASWLSHQNTVNDSSELLPLDMVADDHSIYRILSAISHPLKWAPSHQRPWCMNCNVLVGAHSKIIHCQHCGRHICGACTRRKLSPDYFPKSFETYDAAWVCLICEKILVARKEEETDTLRLSPY